MSARTRTQQLAREFYDRGDPIGWFEEVYSLAQRDVDQVPWASQVPNPYLTSWIHSEYAERGSKTSQTALVVAVGLGDDAEVLAASGFRVTAFDIADTAIQWAKSRFPDSTVQYAVADLFDPPSNWQNLFDFVFESSTLQALPYKLRAAAIEKIASFVAPGGTLLVVTLGRDEHDDAGQLPWPLTRCELDAFVGCGLQALSFRDVTNPEGRRVFVATYRQPELARQ